jgi:hypothetical protein
MKQAMESEKEELRALAPLFADLDLSQITEGIPYATVNFDEALRESGIKCPKVDEKLFKKYIDYYVKIGFLPPYPNG